jgi:hypothetical protein
VYSSTEGKLPLSIPPQRFAQSGDKSYNNMEHDPSTKERCMTTPVQAVITAAQRLSPAEQFAVIQALTQVLQQRYASLDDPARDTALAMALPPTVRRTPLVTNVAHFAAAFWPADETADAITAYLAQQRAADRMSDLPDGDL